MWDRRQFSLPLERPELFRSLIVGAGASTYPLVVEGALKWMIEAEPLPPMNTVEVVGGFLYSAAGLLNATDPWAAAVYPASSRRRCSIAGRRAPNDSRSRTAAVYTLRVGDRRERRHRGGDPIDALPELRLGIDLSKSHLHARDVLHELVERRLGKVRAGSSESRSNFGGDLLVPVRALFLAVHTGPPVSYDPSVVHLLTAGTFRTYVRQMT